MEPVHEGFVNKSKKHIGTLNNSIWQFPFKNSEEVLNKTNKYSTLGSQKLKDKKIKGRVSKAFFHGLWAFIKHYIFKLGFLDGGSGFVIAFSNFEGTFYRYLKLLEAQKNWIPPVSQPIRRNTE